MKKIISRRDYSIGVPGILIILWVPEQSVVPKEPNDRNLIVESKGVVGDHESEGS